MLIKLFHIISLVMPICCIIMSCNTQEKDSVTIKDIKLSKLDGEKSITDLFEDFQLIPLENKRECMLSNVQKLTVTDDKYYIYNEGGDPAVLCFRFDGEFSHRIGSLGRSKSEYPYINDMALNEKEHVISLLLDNEVKVYDALSGEYLYSKEIDSSTRIQKIEWLPLQGYIGCSNHIGADYQIYMFDSLYNVIEKILPSTQEVTSVLSYETNPIQVDGKRCCFFDFHTSTFHFIDSEHPHSVLSHVLLSANILTMAGAASDSYYQSTYDCVISECFAEKKVIGLMNYDKRICYFIYDIEKETFRIYQCLDWPVGILDYHNGYYYAVITPDDLIDIIKEDSYMPTNTQDVIREALAACHDYQLLDKNNYLILKMKLKKGL